MINVRCVILISLFCLIISSHSFGQEPTDKEYELLEAAEKGQSQKVLKLLNENINPNVQDYYGMGPLHYAAQNNHIKCVKALILNGGKVNMRDYDDRIALHLAVHFSNLDVAEFLVQKGAKINAKDNYGLSPLFYSSAYGDFLMSDMFLFYSKGEQVYDPEGRTPFLAAVWGGHIPNADLLLKYFSKIDEKDSEGNSALFLAVLNRDLEMIDSLVSWGCKINEVNKNGYSCLDIAIQENASAEVEKLLILGADPNHKIKKGINSLDLALHFTQNSEIAMIMEEAGAKRNKRPSFSQPAINVRLNTGFHDVFSTLQMEIWEPKYGIGFSLGASQRLGRIKVLTPIVDHVRYQYRETRTGILVGIEKQWMLLRLNRNNRIGMNIGFDMGLFFGHNKGSEVYPDKIWAPMPSFGLYWQSKSWQLGFSGIHQDMKTYQLPALRFETSLTYRFNELK